MAEEVKTPGVETPEQPAAEPAGKEEPVSFTPKQQEFINSLIAKEYKKINDKAEKKMQEMAEAEKLKNMTDAERMQAELKAAKEKIANFERQQLINQYEIELAEKGLPKEIAKYIPVSEAEAAKEVVDRLGSYRASVEEPLKTKIAELEEELKNASLRGYPPKSVGAAGDRGGVPVGTGLGAVLNEHVQNSFKK